MRSGTALWIRRRRSCLARGLAVCGASLVTSCQRAGILDPGGPVADAERLIMINATAIMLVVVVPVILATLLFAWWYRASNPRAARNPEMTYEGRLEFVVWSIPALIVMLLGGVIWIGSHELDPRLPIAAATEAGAYAGAETGGGTGPGAGAETDAEPLRIDVVSLDWKWLFIYPDEGVAALNELVVPAGRPISFRLTSATVMNSFFVPQLGSQIYTMGGMTTRLSLRADRPGEFTGFSANYSGAGFAEMRFVVRAVPTDAYDRWLAEVHEEASALDDSTYDELARPSRAVPPETWRSVAPDLFDWIVARTAGRDVPGEAASATAWCRADTRTGG